MNIRVVKTAIGKAENRINGRILPDLKLLRSIILPMTKSAIALMTFATRMIAATIIRSALKRVV